MDSSNTATGAPIFNFETNFNNIYAAINKLISPVPHTEPPDHCLKFSVSGDESFCGWPGGSTMPTCPQCFGTPETLPGNDPIPWLYYEPDFVPCSSRELVWPTTPHSPATNLVYQGMYGSWLYRTDANPNTTWSLGVFGSMGKNVPTEFYRSDVTDLWDFAIGSPKNQNWRRTRDLVSGKELSTPVTLTTAELHVTCQEGGCLYYQVLGGHGPCSGKGSRIGGTATDVAGYYVQKHADSITPRPAGVLWDSRTEEPAFCIERGLWLYQNKAPDSTTGSAYWYIGDGTNPPRIRLQIRPDGYPNNSAVEMYVDTGIYAPGTWIDIFNGKPAPVCCTTLLCPPDPSCVCPILYLGCAADNVIVESPVAPGKCT